MFDKVTINFLNAGKGDSIVIKLEGSNTQYLVLDCNKIKINNSLINPVLTYLKKENASIISALILTHLHTDHCYGMDELFENFTIEKFCFPPFLSNRSPMSDEIVAKFKAKLIETTNGTNEKVIQEKLTSLAKVLKFMKDPKNQEILMELEGPDMNFRVGSPEIVGKILLPFPDIKGVLYKKIELKDFEFDSFSSLNDMSIALMLEIFDKRILLAGDSEINHWLRHRTFSRKNKIYNLKTNYLKVPHHGSKNNNSFELYEYFFDLKAEDNYIFISADGREHPHNIIFELISEHSLIPYCTNLAHQCMGDHLTGMFMSPQIVQSGLFDFLMHYPVYKNVTQCQGDIRLICTSENFRLENSTGFHCLYR